MASENNNLLSVQSNTLTACLHTTPPDPYHTCRHPYHAGYSESNLPPLLFRLDMPALESLPRLDHLMENGQFIVDATGHFIRDFPFLPRYISIRPPGWLLEFWSRTDRRLTYRDIKARMSAPTDHMPADNLLNVRREREARGPLGLSCWTGRNGEITRVEVERVERWSLDQVYFNTTMMVEYGLSTSGKTIPLRLRAKMLQEGTPTYYPLNTFLDQKHTWIPSPRIINSISLLWKLTQRAKELGLETWQVLPAEELPGTWKLVKSPKRFSYINIKEDDNGVYPLRHQNRKIFVPQVANTHAASADNTETAEEQGPVPEESTLHPEERSGNDPGIQTEDTKEDPSDDDLPLILRRQRVLKAARAKADTCTTEGIPVDVPSIPAESAGEDSSDEDMPLMLKRRHIIEPQMKRKRACSPPSDATDKR